MILHPSVVKWAMRRSLTRTYNGFIKEARTRYATVRVFKMKTGWVLRYLNEKPSESTGPFDTVDEAVAWFLGGGR